MSQTFDQALSSYSPLWESGNYVLNHWRDSADDILLDCMIFEVNNKEFVRIEDDRLSYAVKQRMREAGVPILRELPPGKHVLQQAFEELAEIMEVDELCAAYEELRLMHVAGMSNLAIEERLGELKNAHTNVPKQVR